MAPSSLDDVKQHFSSDSSANEWPEFLRLDTDENYYEFELNVHEDIRWFEGHFPEQAVLAGVVQTHWAGELGRFLFLRDAPNDRPFIRIDNLKFQAVILPTKTIRLALTYKADASADTVSIAFRFFDATAQYSMGKLIFSQHDTFTN